MEPLLSNEVSSLKSVKAHTLINKLRSFVFCLKLSALVFGGCLCVSAFLRKCWLSLCCTQNGVDLFWFECFLGFLCVFVKNSDFLFISPK